MGERLGAARRGGRCRFVKPEALFPVRALNYPMSMLLIVNTKLYYDRTTLVKNQRRETCIFNILLIKQFEQRCRFLFMSKSATMTSYPFNYYAQNNHTKANL